MLNYGEVITVKQKYPTMHASDKDFYMQYVTIEKRNPQTIYEFGVGSGEWIMCMNECLSYDPLWIGVENFVSAYTEEDYYGPLPKSPAELIEQINLKNFRHFYTPWEPILGEKIQVECARVDMNLKNWDIVTDHCDTLFIDDVFKPEYEFRLLEALNSDMGALWYGEKEVCLIRD